MLTPDTLRAAIHLFTAVAGLGMPLGHGAKAMAPYDAEKLTLARALDEASKHSPLLTQAKAQVEGAKANLAGQRAPANPTLTISNPNTPPPSGPNFKDLADYQLSVPIETNGAMSWRTSVAKNQLAAIQADAATIRITLIQAVKDAYIELEAANAALLTEQQSYDYTKKLSELTEKQFKLGSSPETDSIRASIALTQEESNLIAAQSRVRIAKINLNVLLGREPEKAIDAAEEIKAPEVQPNLEDLKKIAEANRPELKSAQFNLRLLQATVGLQRTELLPQMFATTDFSEAHTGSVQLGINIPVDLGSVRGAVRKAEQDVKAQAAQVEQVRLSIGADVQNAIDGVLRTQKVVKTYQNGVLPQSESLLNRITRAYQLGASTILNVLDAENAFRTANVGYIFALSDYNHALAALERAVGTNVAATPGMPAKSVPDPTAH
jgi:cobalt-zinc-cadmium efflux system outer membrane protein